MKFRDYKNYPIIGRLSQPIPTTTTTSTSIREYTREQLEETKKKKTTTKGEDVVVVVPKGRIHAPLLVGICGQVR